MKHFLSVPILPESVSQALVAKWHASVGDRVKRDQSLIDIETDKVVLEVVSPSDGVLIEIQCPAQSIVTKESILGVVEEKTEIDAQIETKREASPQDRSDSQFLTPSARSLVSEHQIDPEKIKTSGLRVTKDDVLNHMTMHKEESKEKSSLPERVEFKEGSQKREKMSSLRKKIAQRLKYAQNEGALLTTFNEIDMTAIIHLREEYKDVFEKKKGIKLGFMSFFMKAVSQALEHYPMLNAYIDGDDIIYNSHVHIAVAVSTERGLVVPVIQNVEQLSFDECEKNLADMADKARQGKLSLDDLSGGTFTITNGGVFGSLLSTPLINPPQSGILGMHKIEKRPVVVDDQIVIRPMMYVALTYDHRLIDGAQAVGFLVSVKKCLENPEQFFLNIL